MKLVFSNGRRLEVRDVGEPLVVIVADQGTPLKCINAMMTDDDARRRIKEILHLRIYRRVK